MKFDRYFLALKALLNAKYVFHEPEKEDLLIFDGESLNQLKYILPSFKYQVIETRINRIKEIYITPKIFFSTIRNIKTNILNSYLLTLVDIIKPKVVFTFIDNSEKFSEFAALRKKKYKFVALQNGARYEHRTYKELFKKKIISKGYVKFNIPYFLCFGENEVEDYKKYHDPIISLKEYILKNNKNVEEDLKNVEKDVKETVKESADYAQNSDEPSASELYADVYK